MLLSITALRFVLGPPGQFMSLFHVLAELEQPLGDIDLLVRVFFTTRQSKKQQQKKTRSISIIM